jgi:protein-S-isoprenylcysteine O-methyltransferase Ste14
VSQQAASGSRNSWWRGARGEWFVVVQIALIGLVFFGPRSIAGWPAWSIPFPPACRAIGLVLMVGGGGLLLAGLVGLRRGLTPLPYPKEGAALVQTGPFALVRHPIYSGGLALALGWALFTRSWLTLGYVGLLFGLLDLKSRREERWLAGRFPAYEDYRRRVRRLIPFVY